MESQEYQLKEECMKNIIGESYYQLKYITRNKIKQINSNSDWVYRHYVGKPFLDVDALNKKVYTQILSGEPFMMGRFGAFELFNMRTAEFHRKSNAAKACDLLSTCAGFFPNDPARIPRFNEVMKDACAQVDILGIWQNPCEDYYIKHYCTSLSGTCLLEAIEPWNCTAPWSAALKGKKVLVIHPFEDSILKQYAHRDKLFQNPNLLPEFDLKTLKAVQTAGTATDDRFTDWFEALAWMCRECEKLDFDIALVGCGAYGFPLAAHIKKMGKQAIHFGGSLQILFGIKGRRWDELMPKVSAMYNDYWNYPLDCERPKGSSGIEGGTYWKKD